MKLIICTPRAFAQELKANLCTQLYYKTAAGTLKLSVLNNRIYQALFCDDTSAPTAMPDLSTLLLVGTPFQIKVWQAAAQIPVGKTVTYQQLAHTIGHPRAWRAVATALGQNKIAYFIPCHRVVRSNGTLGGYKWGIERKEQLLTVERSQ